MLSFHTKNLVSVSYWNLMKYDTAELWTHLLVWKWGNSLTSVCPLNELKLSIWIFVSIYIKLDRILWTVGKDWMDSCRRVCNVLNREIRAYILGQERDAGIWNCCSWYPEHSTHSLLLDNSSFCGTNGKKMSSFSALLLSRQHLICAFISC